MFKSFMVISLLYIRYRFYSNNFKVLRRQLPSPVDYILQGRGKSDQAKLEPLETRSSLAQRERVPKSSSNNRVHGCMAMKPVTLIIMSILIPEGSRNILCKGTGSQNGTRYKVLVLFFLFSFLQVSGKEIQMTKTCNRLFLKYRSKDQEKNFILYR